MSSGFQHLLFSHWVWQRAQHGCRAVWGTGHRPFHLQRLFLPSFLSAGSLGNARTSGCGKLLSSKHPLETPAGGGRRLSDKLQEATSSPLRRTLKGGAGQRTKCGWEVSKASEDSASLTSAFNWLLILFPGGGGVQTWKGHQVEVCEEGKRIYCPLGS